ncbi:hypothetical protein ACTFIW_000989 [Dictyostelium discoideum]
MADLTTSMDHQVMLHQIATIPSLQKVPTTVFRRTRSKLTSRWTSIPPQTSLERIGSSKLLSRGRKWIKSPYKPMPNQFRFLLQRVYGSKTWNDSTSSSSRFKEVKHLHQQPIVQDGRNKESTIDGQTRLLHGKTRYQESLPPRISRSTIQRLIPLRVERIALPLENNTVRVIDSSSYLYNAVKTCTSNVVEGYQRILHRLLGRSINHRFNKRRMFFQPQKDNGLTCQTRFQVKSGKKVFSNQLIQLRFSDCKSIRYQ